MTGPGAVTEAEERAQQERTSHFESLYAEWLRARAAQVSVYDDDLATRLSEQEYRLAREITATPAPCPWQVGRKFEVLEHYLGDFEEGTSHTDSREVMMLAGIKADIIRFGLKRPD